VTPAAMAIFRSSQGCEPSINEVFSHQKMPSKALKLWILLCSMLVSGNVGQTNKNPLVGHTPK
jgi:hypothetical protein